MYKDVLNLVGLFDLDAYPDTVDARLDQDTLILVSGDGQRIEQNLRRGFGFNLRHIMTFRCL
jgi:hypothetical protein